MDPSKHFRHGHGCGYGDAGKLRGCGFGNTNAVLSYQTCSAAKGRLDAAVFAKKCDTPEKLNTSPPSKTKEDTRPTPTLHPTLGQLSSAHP